MDHPYRNSLAPSEGGTVIGEIRRARPVLVILLGVLAFLLLVFALGVHSIGWTFLWSPGVLLLSAMALVLIVALSLPYHGEIGRAGIVLRFVYGERTASLDELRQARRTVLNPALLEGKDGLILLTVKSHGLLTRICLIALSGRNSSREDPWLAGSYDTVVDRILVELQGPKEESERS